MIYTKVLLGAVLLSLGSICWAVRMSPMVPELRGRIFLSNKGAAPPVITDCDADNEEGDFYMDTAKSRLYVCFPNGWRKIATTPK